MGCVTAFIETQTLVTQRLLFISGRGEVGKRPRYSRIISIYSRSRYTHMYEIPLVSDVTPINSNYVMTGLTVLIVGRTLLCLNQSFYLKTSRPMRDEKGARGSAGDSPHFIVHPI
jgi:hypothetical protein